MSIVESTHGQYSNGLKELNESLEETFSVGLNLALANFMAQHPVIVKSLDKDKQLSTVKRHCQSIIDKAAKETWSEAYRDHNIRLMTFSSSSLDLNEFKPNYYETSTEYLPNIFQPLVELSSCELEEYLNERILTGFDINEKFKILPKHILMSARTKTALIEVNRAFIKLHKALREKALNDIKLEQKEAREMWDLA
ncbi:hypothetical protein [Vibrio parahaemolyticus]|uniref:hypothetical protein n=1 Tax=Vibrio parahaemolyticus TaxID=670 RepID=UPI0027E5ADB4|nr:hypothetical protein [Vibrio parahaemolyticus]WMN84120.1 hypothetical protein NI384_06380 [Vibrio parahaemolyticus]